MSLRLCGIRTRYCALIRRRSIQSVCYAGQCIAAPSPPKILDKGRHFCERKGRLYTSLAAQLKSPFGEGLLYEQVSPFVQPHRLCHQRNSYYVTSTRLVCQNNSVGVEQFSYVTGNTHLASTLAKLFFFVAQFKLSRVGWVKKWMGNPPRISCCEGSLSITSFLLLLLLAVLPFYIFKCVLKSIHVFSIISAAGFLKETRRRLKAFTRVVLV